MLALVPCHNDAEALTRALPRMLEALRPLKDRLLVVADRCSDQTAAVARAAGVEVAERTHDAGALGKGGALAWGLAACRERPEVPVAVFDADSEPASDFFEAAEVSFAGGVRAAQSSLVPVPGPAILSRLAAYSEIVSQRFSDRFRQSVGWGVLLRGTGMVIEKGLLEDALARCRTQVEDLELSLSLAERGVRVRRLATSVRDRKPESSAGIASQRARWLAGSLSAFVARRREIGHLMRSAEGLTLVVSLFARPRSVFFSLRLILFLTLLLSGAAGMWRLLEFLLGLFLARDLLFLLGGLFVVDRPLFYLPAVILSPLYPLMWIAAAVRSAGARRTWLSARRPD